MDLAKASREEMFYETGAIPLVDTILQAQYEAEEIAYWRNEQQENKRSEKWHLSFHASSFPINGRISCSRRALYGLMGIPEPEPFSRRSRAVMDAGVDIENQVAKRLKGSGLLLSGFGTKQTQFTLKRYWLTGSIDFVILKRVTNSPHVVECKTKSRADVEAMRKGEKRHDEQHYGQLQCYIAGVRIGQEAGKIFPTLEICHSGSIIYLARDDPSITAEFYFKFDKELVDAAFAKLEAWKQAYLDEELLPRPKTYQWSKTPCQWCPFKKACKEDDKEGVVFLHSSNAIDFAKLINPEYNYYDVWREVIDSWK